MPDDDKKQVKNLRSFSQQMRQPSTQDLEKAILVGDVEQVHRLIAVGVDVSGQSASGGSLLMLAGIQRHVEITQVLREAGANVGLLEAALLGDVDTLQVLLDGGANVNKVNVRHYSALTWAIYRF